jgi:hypothetical protein
MSESINVENKKQNTQKPPLSLARIACEILAGAVAGFAVAFPLTYVTGIVLAGKGKGEYAGVGFMAMFLLVFPPLYVLGSTFGVYLVGSRGNQTGSFLPALGCGFLGGFFMKVMLPQVGHLSGVLIVGVEKIVLWTICVLVLLIPPIVTTFVFNLTRRYKEQPSS